jgi:hypothetical protein
VAAIIIGTSTSFVREASAAIKRFACILASLQGKAIDITLSFIASSRRDFESITD